MNLFWCTQTNRIVLASPCSECGGYAWRFLGPDTAGAWMFGGCYPVQPDGEMFLRVKKLQEKQPSPTSEGDLK